MTIQGQAVRALPEAASADPLPAEIAFLGSHGVAPTLLRQAASLAAASGVAADDALLKHGLLDEDSFYRALAREASLPFLAGGIAVDRGTRFPASVLAGIVPLRGRDGPARFALAPRGEGLARRLARRGHLERGLAITTPSALRHSVFQACAASIASRAAHELPQARPHHSFRDQISFGQFMTLLAAVGVGAFLLTLAPRTSLTGLTLLSAPVFLSMVALRIAAACEAVGVEPPHPPRRHDDRNLPVYTVIVPLYRERRVLARLVAALRALDYPEAKLDVKFVIEADDRETAQALAAMSLPGFVEVIVAPPGAPRTKPRALNVALPLARGEFTVVYDAEDVPQPEQLRLAVATFARLPADVSCLQARLVIDNTQDGWLTRLFTIEYAALFDVINPGLMALDLPVPLGGTSNHFRTAVLRTLHGWDAWNVTEDADLGVRLALMGHRVADLPSSTYEEAPAALGAWMRQRTRWMKGFMQVCVTHGREPLRALRVLGPARFFGALTMTFGTVLAALGYPFFVALSVADLCNGTLLRAATWLDAGSAATSLTLFAAGWIAMIAPAIVALKRRRRWRLLADVPMLPAYYVLVSAAAWRGLAEFVLDPFRWNKTEHGLARTSHSGALRTRPEAPAPPPRASGSG